MVRIVTTGDSISTLKLVRLLGWLRKELFTGTTERFGVILVGHYQGDGARDG